MNDISGAKIKNVNIKSIKSTNDLIDYISVSRATIQRDIVLLKSHHLIELIGADKVRRYVLNDALKNKLNKLRIDK
ncbi:MAG: HTH domain-containing protein [Bacteroidales bacterium]|nr:HTH domain-containing protein [Bacteroidales bacterium]